MKQLHISSLQNPQVKDVVKLRGRSHRKETGMMLVEGITAISHALNSGHVPEKLFLPDSPLNDQVKRIAEQCDEAGAAVFLCSENVMNKMSYKDSAENILAVMPSLKNNLDEIELNSTTLILVAESIEKPGNLGAMIRSADSAGADAVIVCDRNTDISNPNVVRASIGTIFCLPVIEAPSADTISWLKDNGFTILAAAPDAEQVYTEVNMRGPTAIVLGTEHDGLSETWINAADTPIRIPMLGQADSLNVSASAALMLYEAVRQRSGEI